MCGDGTDFIRRHQRWQGMQSLPRVITFDPWAGSLVFFPVQELTTLRQQPALYPDGRRITLPALTDDVLASAASQGIRPRVSASSVPPQGSTSLNRRQPQLQQQQDQQPYQPAAKASSMSDPGLQKLSDGLSDGSPDNKQGITMQVHTSLQATKVAPQGASPAQQASHTSASTDQGTERSNQDQTSATAPKVQEQSPVLLPGSREALDAYCHGELFPEGFATVSTPLVPEEPAMLGDKRRHMEVRASFGLKALRMAAGQAPLLAPFKAGIMLRTGGSGEAV